MAARYFGAGPGSARRRRRLILSVDAPEDQVAPAPRRSAAAAQDAGAQPLERTRVVTRLNSLIRPQPWINWLLVAMGFGVWGGVIWSGWVIDRGPSGLKDVLGLRAGHVCRIFAVSSLFAVTQFSLIILWYRTRSRKDFEGRYRIWIWSSLTWALFFSAAIIRWHATSAAWFAGQLPRRLHNLSDMFWLIPAVVVFGATCRLLSKEMTRTPATRWLLRGGVCVAAISAILQVDPGLIPAPLRLEYTNGAVALWPFLLAAALLHHARYVIHITNEVSPLMSGRRNRLPPVMQQVWAEVWSLGPSRGMIAKALAPKRMYHRVKFALKLCRRFLSPLVTALGRRCRLIGRGADRPSKTDSAPRRKEAASLPVASSATTEPRARMASQQPPRKVKSA